jgi:putative flippase GtrA
MRFWRFNAVGLLGFAVQLGLLALLVQAGVHYLAATALAVEAAILHNFLWHERWTWRDRPGAGLTRLARLARFHVVNGGVSLAGNMLLMPLLVGAGGLPVLAANGLAVLACAVVNFFGADRIVFLRPNPSSLIPDPGSRVAHPYP